MLLLPSAASFAQKKKGPEFTKQGILVSNFAPGPGADRRLGRRAGDVVRDRVADVVPGREAFVVSGNDLRYRLEQGGFEPDSPLDAVALRATARFFRADEAIEGAVRHEGNTVTLAGAIRLVRDIRMYQPLPVVTAADLPAAATLLAREVVAARAQLVPQRRCENALRDGYGSQAIAEATRGIAAYPRSTLARTCLLWALRATNAPPAAQLDVAREILAIDRDNAPGLEGAALALDSLGRHHEAGDHWVRLAATDTGDMALLTRVVWALAEAGESARAVPLAVPASKAHPEEADLRRLAWRVSFDAREWPIAIGVGEQLLGTTEITGDSAMLADPAFFRRLASAYRFNGEPFKAVALAARGVTRFPDDARLYALYAQLVRAESDTVIPRGLALFPRSAELQAIRGQDLKSRGRAEEALEATRLAVSLDSTLAQGDLAIAQGEFELGRPDSALVALHRALAHGEDSALVAQFALSKGNTLYRAANGTRARKDFELALGFIALADSARVSSQAKFLLGAAALGAAQATLTDAARVANAGGPASRTEGCGLAQRGSSWLPIAREALVAGQAVAPEAVQQMTGFLGQLEEVAGKQRGALCPSE